MRTMIKLMEQFPETPAVSQRRFCCITL